tara:strand:+ start:508 stop:804 length:297 start_codon:yes stop_codon:yes gene_type:complete
VTEKAFQADVIRVAKMLGWLCYHTFDSRRSASGFPDLVLVRERILYRELKVGKNKLSPTQELWRDSIMDAGGDWAEWRETDMDDIVADLSRRPTQANS